MVGWRRHQGVGDGLGAPPRLARRERDRHCADLRLHDRVRGRRAVDGRAGDQREAPPLWLAPMTPELVLDAKALNGESPRWSTRERKLYWVDTRGPYLHVFDPVTNEDKAWEMPSWIGCQMLSRDGCVLAMRTGLYAFHAAEASLRAIGQPPYDIRR